MPNDSEHTFLYHHFNTAFYRDNMEMLLKRLNGDARLVAVKSYMLFTILSYKHGMMLKREHYAPNLQVAFQYQSYQIHHDKGKNYDCYQSYIVQYEYLRRFNQDAQGVDIGLCDFGFAYLSPFSEWYYQYCHPDMAIPMTLCQKARSVEPTSFLMLFCYKDYSDYDIGAFEIELPDISALGNSHHPRDHRAFLPGTVAWLQLQKCIERLEHTSNILSFFCIRMQSFCWKRKFSMQRIYS